MNRENEKAMFANLKTHRIKNLPSLDNEHFLINPKDSERVLMLRNAQRLSAKTSEQRNKAFLRQKEYDDSWKRDVIYFLDPEYKKIEDKINELQKHRFSRDNYEQYEKNKPLIQELENQLDDIKNKYENNRRNLKKTRKSSSISFSVLHRNASQNNRDLNNLINNKNWYDVDYDVRDKLTKIKPKGYDSTKTPDFKNDMLIKTYDLENKEQNPIRDKIEKFDNLVKLAEKKYDNLKYKDVDDPEREKAFNEMQSIRKQSIELTREIIKSNEKFDRLHDSVHGHIPKFKR